MATLVTRSGKGSPLTHDEVDANFTNLNTDKLESSDLTAGTGISISGTTITNSDPDQTVSITGLGIVSVSGTYPNFDVSVEALQSSDIGSTVQAYDANLTSFVSAFTLPTTDGTNGQALATNASGTLSFIDVASDPTLGTLTQSFGEGESVTVSLSSSVSPTAVVAVTKEVGQTGASSKGAWDVNTTASNYELYDQAPATSLTIGKWGISTASFVQSFSVAAQDGTPRGVFFKPDGLKMYVVGSVGDDVNEYDLSTAWDVSTASFLQNFSVAAQDGTPRGVFFKPDGLKMYITGDDGNDVNEYDLSTAWDVSSASFLQRFSVAGQDTNPASVFFKPDGLKMYITGETGQDINEYDLSTAWDISTASFLQNFSVVAQDTIPTGVFFKPDGAKMYVAGRQGQDINEYDLSTAWDISTASFSSNGSVGAQETIPQGIFFKPDGTKVYVVGFGSDAVHEYDVSGPFVLGTGSFSASDVGKRIFVDDGGEAILTATDGSYSLVSEFGASSYTSGNWSLTGLDVDATNGIALSLGEVGTWDVSGASYVQNFGVGSQETEPNGVFFKPDGTKMYIVGFTGDDVNEYNLSTAWDVSTASFLQNFSVLAQDSVPLDLFFKPDGTKMYILGSTGDDVNEYSLSTAWDVSTASFVHSYSVVAVQSQPTGVFFKPDGTKMYVVGRSGGSGVDEFDLSTAWNVATASFLQFFSVNLQETLAQGLFFKSDGTKMYVIGNTGDDVNEYDLSTAWDISTASFLQVFSVAGQETEPNGVFFKPDGNKMYIVGSIGNSVYEYDVGAIYQPTAQYLPAITSSAGQIDSTYWTDINSMTADDADNDGQVYYAVSTDDRTTWSIAKASDGVRDIVRNNGGTWQYNSAEGTPSIESASLVGTHSVTAQDTTPTGIFFKPDGTKMYIGGLTNDRIYEYSLSTAWQVSTASYTSLFSNSVVFSAPRDIFFKPDGTKMYILDDVADDIFEYNLSTAWDITTSSYVQSFYIYSQEQNAAGLFFKPDGTEMYIVDRGGQDSHQYTLSTAWNISTASLTATGPNTTGMHSIQFTSDGLSMYLKDQSGIVSEYALSTAWLISSATATGVTFASGVNSTGATLADGGNRLYIVGSDDVVYQYSNVGYTTSATWNSATTNNEFAALAEALGATTLNQMDKAQVDAVADGSHFTLGNTLDLAIVPYLASAGTAPTSDGITLNYDAAALNKGAILGTDYDYDVPAGDKVRITALAANNLKVRIV